MQHTVPSLHQVGILVLLVVGLVLIAHVALAALHPADDGEGQAAVLRKRHRHRAAQAGPCSLAGHGVRGAGGVIGNGDAAALQLDRADAGVVVGQRGGCGHRPSLAPVKGLAAVDAVGLAVAHKGHQMPRLQLDDIGMDMAVAAGHHDHAPSFTLVVRDTEGGGVAGQTLGRVGAQPVGKDPAAVGQHLNGLAAEGAFLREHGGVVAPCFAAVGALLAAHHSGELHIVLTLYTVQLGGVHRPHGVVRAVEQRGVLLAAGGVAGDIHRLQPLGTVMRQHRADDVHICAALISTGEPAAEQVTVGQLHHGRCVGGGPAAGGQQGFQRAHLLVLVHGAVPSQAGQFCIGHGHSPSVTFIFRSSRKGLSASILNALQCGLPAPPADPPAQSRRTW